MNKFYEYYPAFFEGFESKDYAFDSIKDFYSIPRIKNVIELEKFKKFIIDPPSGSESRYYISAMYDDGKRFVVGFLDKDITNELAFDYFKEEYFPDEQRD